MRTTVNNINLKVTHQKHILQYDLLNCLSVVRKVIHIINVKNNFVSSSFLQTRNEPSDVQQDAEIQECEE
jgi:hypothetical protein